MSAKYPILIVDDEPFLRMSLKLILSHVGYQIEEAGTASEALNLASAQRFDLIFLDLQLLDHDGLQLLPKLKKMQPLTPVLILTADGSLERAAQAMRMGAYEYLLKPVEPGRIIAQVDDILRQRRIPLVEIKEQRKNPAAKVITSEDCPSIRDLSGETTLEAGDLALNLLEQTVRVKERYIRVPPCTFEYLVTLYKHSPRVVPFQILVGESQGYWLSALEAQDLARWRIYRLRNALEEHPGDPRYIISEPGIGYRLKIK